MYECIICDTLGTHVCVPFVSLFASAHSICCIHGICSQRVGVSAYYFETKGEKKSNKQTIKKNRSGTIERHPSLLWNVWDCHDSTSIILFLTGTMWLLILIMLCVLGLRRGKCETWTWCHRGSWVCFCLMCVFADITRLITNIQFTVISPCVLSLFISEVLFRYLSEFHFE